ncbi:MAG: hypothetical protein LBG52_07635 [Candidatus Peribacteria bacterium]|jgi:histidinol phosphatase-like enzyme|nr:hypothetical protein [Candidatus Peribacteria bacterium]
MIKILSKIKEKMGNVDLCHRTYDREKYDTPEEMRTPSPIMYSEKYCEEITSAFEQDKIIWDSKIIARVDHLAAEHNIIKGNTLSKMKQLNVSIQKNKGYTTATESKIYKLKDEIILEYLRKTQKIIIYKGEHTTVHIRQGNTSVDRHLGRNLKKKLRTM